MNKQLLTKEIADKFLSGDVDDIESFSEITDDAAESLSKHKGELLLDGLTSLSDAAAEMLSKHEGGWISLWGLASLSDAAAESLSKYRGELSLSAEASRFAIVEVCPSGKDFSNSSSTREIIAELEAYLDHELGCGPFPSVTFIDETGKKKVAFVRPTDRILIEGA